MKKSFLKIALGAVICLAAGYTIHNVQTKDGNLSELKLANVEALAQKENDGPPKEKVKCYDTIKEKKSSMVIFCGSCNYVEGSAEAAFSSDSECTPD